MRRSPLLLVSLQLMAWPARAALAQETPADPADKIADAVSAAPAAISAEATVMDWPSEPGGGMVELRKGSNAWVCFPDSPGSPRNDPMCLDPSFLAWARALSARTEPAIESVGFGYMLQGGSTASNTDPFAETPPAGGTWLEEPPHVMMVVPDPAALEGLPTDPENGGPWVMWQATPYAHVMMPVEAEGEASADR
jgi:hypothetical protein